MGLMNPHYSDSPLCLQCWPWLPLTMAKNTSLRLDGKEARKEVFPGKQGYYIPSCPDC